MAKRQAALVLIDPQIPEDHFLMEGIDTSVSGPHFSVNEVAKFFFARTPHWIRKMERTDILVLDGERVGRRRTAKGARTYLLEDIEKMAHALAAKSNINHEELRRILHLVRLCAQQHKHLNAELKPVGGPK